jgi:hypothetical protein
MFPTMTKTPRALISVALILAGPICEWLLAHEHVMPVWVSQAIGMVVTICGIGMLGSLMRQTSRQ